MKNVLADLKDRNVHLPNRIAANAVEGSQSASEDFDSSTFGLSARDGTCKAQDSDGS